MALSLFRLRSGGQRKNKNSSASLATMEEAPPELMGGHDLPVSPRLWLLLGILYMGLGATQLVLAAMWRWWFGVAVGAGILKTGSSLAGLGYTGGKQVRRDASTLLGKLGQLLLRVVLWGSAKVQQLLWRLRWLVYAYGVWAALLIAIHLSSPDPRPPPAAFPPACPTDKRFGCSRVAVSLPHFARGLHPVYVPAGVGDVQAAAEAWVGAQAGGRVLASRPGFFSARFVTLFWGFADDFFVSVRCANATHAVIEAQGQLRIGTSDLGVNKRRNRRFLLAMEAAAAEGAISPGLCRGGDSSIGSTGGGTGDSTGGGTGGSIGGTGSSIGGGTGGSMRSTGGGASGGENSTTGGSGSSVKAAAAEAQSMGGGGQAAEGAGGRR